MIQIEPGDIVQNPRGWQGRVLSVIAKDRRVLVEYASRREWEGASSLFLMCKEKKDLKNE